MREYATAYMGRAMPAVSHESLIHPSRTFVVSDRRENH